MGFQGQQIVLDEWMDVGSGGCATITAEACYNGNISTFHMIAHWRMNESSGSRVDVAPKLVYLPTVVSPWNLNDPSGPISAPGATAGILGNAALFVRGSNHGLTQGGAAIPWAFDDFTLTGWIRPTSFAGIQAVFTHGSWGTVFGSPVYGPWALYSESGKLRFGITSAGGPPTYVELPLTLGAWQFFVAWHDSSEDKIFIEINNSTIASAAWNLGVDHVNPSHTFFAGLDNGELGAGANFLDAALDSLSIWGRALTAAERQLLYNNGAGLDFPFTF